jgi:hypothetical protein
MMQVMKVPVFWDPNWTHIKSNFALKQNHFVLVPFAANCLPRKGLCIGTESDESLITMLILSGFQIPVPNTRGLHQSVCHEFCSCYSY